MISVSIRELKQQTSKPVRKVREEGAEIQVTYRGEVVALLMPVTRQRHLREPEAWANLDQLAAEIGARWQKGASAVEAVSECRR